MMSAMRDRAMAMYSLERSIPMNRLPCSRAIFPVVPLPENGSKHRITDDPVERALDVRGI